MEETICKAHAYYASLFPFPPSPLLMKDAIFTTVKRQPQTNKHPSSNPCLTNLNKKREFISLCAPMRISVVVPEIGTSKDGGIQ